MELEARISDISKVVREHREALLTEEAAKTAFVMPFLQALGYNVFNPSEVIPEFTCDVGTKKGEKVDYAICQDGRIRMLVECKPASSELNINHASQLFRYFTTTDARLAVLTNGVVYKFFSDIDSPNKMDEKPFFTLQLDSVRKSDIKTLEGFTKQSFDIDKIVHAAGTLKLQSLVYKALQDEFQEPSEEFIRLIAARVQAGRFTTQVKDTFRGLIINSVSSLIRDKVTERLASALTATNPIEETEEQQAAEPILTTQEEVDGYNIVRAIASRVVDPKRVIMRDAKSYCAILLDDNNRRTIARLHFNSPTARYLGTFDGKDEARIAVLEPIEIYKHEKAILARIQQLDAQNGG